MQVICRVAVLICILCAYFSNATAQIINRTKAEDSLIKNNTITFRADKFLNTFIFFSNANLFYNIAGDELTIGQSFYGKSLKTTSKNVADDEKFQLLYNHPLDSNFSISAYNNWLYTSEPMSVELNLSERLNGGLGLNYKYLQDGIVGFSAGWERNNQVGDIGSGPILKFNNKLEGYNVDDFLLDVNAIGEYTNLKNNKAIGSKDRQNSIYDIRASIFRIYDKDNIIRLNTQYRRMSSDILLSYLKDSSSGFIPIERRSEASMMLGLDIGYSLSKNLLSNLRLYLENLDVEKFFREYTPKSERSLYNVKPNDLKMSLAGDISMVLKSIRQTFGLGFNLQQVKNNVSREYDVSDKDLLLWKKQEYQKDYSSSLSQVFSRTEWFPTDIDTIRLNYFVSLSQYDTPSKDMNDDKDILNSIINSTITHRFTDNFVANLTGEIQMMHTVYLKSQMSGLNSWYRILRLSPTFQWTTGIFSIKPKFEILANYTVYDFEDLLAKEESFSHRQVSYKDSIYIFLGKFLSLQSNVSIRYFEEGTLYWNTFSEAVSNRTREYFVKSLLVADVGANIEIGCGLRYFGFYQSDIYSANKIIQQYSYSPETYFKINLRSGSSIIFQGWYEIQNNERYQKRYIPTFYLTTNIQL